MATNSSLLSLSTAILKDAAAPQSGTAPRMADAGQASNNLAGMLQLFVFLQALDVLTTLIGFKLGAAEASPFVRALLHAGPTAGLLLSKLVGLTLCGICVYTHRYRLIRWANYWYSFLAIWNLSVILLAMSRN